MNDVGLAAMRDYAIASGMIKNAPKPNAAPVVAAQVQLYRPGVPFVPHDTVPLSDDEIRARAVGEGLFGLVMFDKGVQNEDS